MTVNVTPDMLDQPVTEASLGDVVSIIGLLLAASGISNPFMQQTFTPPNAFPPNPAFPPSPCDIASQAAFMTYFHKAETVARGHWLEIWKNADALCSGG